MRSSLVCGARGIAGTWERDEPNVPVPGPGGSVQTEYRMRKRGLDTDGWRELREIMKMSDELIPNIKGLAEATGAKMKDVEDLLNAAEDMKRKADKALKADYNQL